MNDNDELDQSMATYYSLETEQDKQNFLHKERQKLAQMTPKQRKLHQTAIAQAVSQIAQRVVSNLDGHVRA